MSKQDKFKMALFAILITISQSLFAQNGKQPYQNRKYYTPKMSREIQMKRDSMLNNADYIFEGVVLNEKYAVDGYHNGDKSEIYSSVKIKITKILRGKHDLKLGTILLLRKGGTIVEYKNGEMHFLDQTPTYKLKEMSHFSSFNTQLFICNKSDLPDNPRNIQVDNPQRVQFFYDRNLWGMIYDKTSNASYVGLGDMEFSSIDELYHFLKKFRNITTRETIDKERIRKEKEALKARQDSGKIRNDEMKKKVEDRLKFIKENLIDKKSKKQKKTSYLKNAAISRNLTFFLKNPKNTGTTVNDRFIEFDVYVRSSVANTYLDNTLVRLAYDTGSAFYSNSASNNDVEVSNGSDFNNSSYEAANFFDYTSSILTIRVGAYTDIPVQRTLVTTASSGQQLAHVKIKIKNDDDYTQLTLTDGDDPLTPLSLFQNN